MKNIIFFLTILSNLLFVGCKNDDFHIEEKMPSKTLIDSLPFSEPFYQQYKDYYVSDDFIVDFYGSYKIFDNIDSLNKTLTVNDYVKDPQIITEKELKDNISIAVLKEYTACSAEMTLDTVLFTTHKIAVYYSEKLDFGAMESGGPNCAAQIQPFVLFITNKKEYTAVEFFENEEFVFKIVK